MEKLSLGLLLLLFIFSVFTSDTSANVASESFILSGRFVSSVLSDFYKVVQQYCEDFFFLVGWLVGVTPLFFVSPGEVGFKPPFLRRWVWSGAGTS